MRTAQGFDQLNLADLLIVLIDQEYPGRTNAVVDGRAPVVRLLRTEAAWTRDGLDPFDAGERNANDARRDQQPALR